MEFELSEEQTAIRDMATNFLAQRWHSDRRREALDSLPATTPNELWQEIVDMGFLGTSVSENSGGSGQPILTSALLAEVAGGALLPGPMISSMVAAIALDRGGNSPELLSAVVTGENRVTLAVEELNGGWGPDLIALSADAVGDHSSVITGTKILVLDGDHADIFLVAVRLPTGLALLQIPATATGVTVIPMHRLDGQSIVELRLDQVMVAEEDIVGVGPDREQVLRDTYDIWTLLLSADLLGNTQAVLKMTTEYARQRKQFGQAIGRFQAVSHRLADILVELEIGRSLLYAACTAFDKGQPDSVALVSAAKAWMSDMAVSSAEAGLQLHGGIGYTWELDIQLYLRQARSNAVSLGDAAYHRERAAKYLAEFYESSLS
jgi:acyl-CoA dehydrogenase